MSITEYGGIVDEFLDYKGWLFALVFGKFLKINGLYYHLCSVQLYSCFKFSCAMQSWWQITFSWLAKICGWDLFFSFWNRLCVSFQWDTCYINLKTLCMKRALRGSSMLHQLFRGQRKRKNQQNGWERAFHESGEDGRVLLKEQLSYNKDGVLWCLIWQHKDHWQYLCRILGGKFWLNLMGERMVQDSTETT